ncbi:hypothetical protein XaC1_127 [Xanthomonas phage XaC1]|nr:hypothetical protein XaC1_127 [Xanthomonas phage XaC1]
MTQYQLDLFLSTHSDKCEEFRKNWYSINCKIHNKGGGDISVEASLSQDVDLDGYTFKFVGFNYDEDISTCKLTTYITNNDDVLFALESYFMPEPSDDDKPEVHYHMTNNELSAICSDHVMITQNRQMKLYKNETNYKILEIDECNLSKDEYFNLSLEYIMPSYELYKHAQNYHKSCPYNSIMYFTERSLKL